MDTIRIVKEEIFLFSHKHIHTAPLLKFYRKYGQTQSSFGHATHWGVRIDRKIQIRSLSQIRQDQGKKQQIFYGIIKLRVTKRPGCRSQNLIRGSQKK